MDKGDFKDKIQTPHKDTPIKNTDELFRAAFEYAPAGMNIIGPDGLSILAVNPELCKMFGYTKEEFLGNTFHLATHPDDEEKSNEWKRKKFNDEPCEPFIEKRYIHKDGHIVWVHIRSHWIKNEDGTHKMAVVHIQDISKRKEAEEQARQTEERFRALFMSLTQGFYISEVIYDDNGKPCDYRYIDVNPQFEKIIGLKREEIIGKTYKELVPVDTTNWLDVYLSVATTGKEQIYEFYSNEYKTHFATYSYILSKGQIIVFVMDVSERKKAEAELEQHCNNLEDLVKKRTLELEEKNQELEKFNELFIGREFRIKELKEKVQELEQKLQDKD
ncbi:MAG: PAS domain S-box protein [Prolixibacteraceae bacterium]|nr:PAS domain S-box protein [Prolixibacteraceae bacterium]